MSDNTLIAIMFVALMVAVCVMCVCGAVVSRRPEPHCEIFTRTVALIRARDAEVRADERAQYKESLLNPTEGEK